MPQLDIINFSNQVFWFIVFFCMFYFVVAEKIVPLFSRILKIRHKKKNQIISNNIYYLEEVTNIKKEYDSVISKVVSEYNQLLSKVSINSTLWSNGAFSQLQNKENKGHSLFIKRLSSFIVSSKKLIKII